MARTRFSLDSSCVVPLVSSWHEHHARTTAAYERLLAEGQVLVLAGHALLECFSVLTRMPPPLRISPATARGILQKYFSSTGICGLNAAVCWSAIEELSLNDLGGRLTYDAVIARSCRDAGASVLLTWNLRDFLRVAPPGLRVREP